ncbi:MAG: hypothetical protein H6811_04745 [Phycisphaeraceae bacterium]|nr:hypothetical protein [Phycisphaeraceae bacterium]
MGQALTDIRPVLERVARVARDAGVFGEVRVSDSRLECEALGSAEAAWYRLEAEGDSLWVSLVMKDRWLSESIESDLMHTGDSLEELLEEELVDQGLEGKPMPCQHFRSDDLLFTFRSAVPRVPGGWTTESAGVVAGQCLLAYEACFRQLGDMHESASDE